MNILIVSSKSDYKSYSAIVESAPNTSVLGAVTSINNNFIADIKNKYHPHAILIDTDVSIKHMSIYDVICDINHNYPYIKVIVITDENDNYDYPVSAILRGQITNVQLCDTIEKISAINSKQTIIDQKLFIEQKPKSDYSGEVVTEKHSDKEDNLSTPMQINYHKPKQRQRKKATKRNNKNIFTVASVAIAFFVCVTIICIILKFCSSQTKSTVSTNDEAVYDKYEFIATERSPEPENKKILVADNNRTAVIEDEENPTSNINPDAEKIAEDVSSSRKNSNSSDSNNNSSNNTKSDSSNYNTSNKSSEQSAQTSNSAVISYDNSKYNNQNNNQVNSIKLSYTKKTLYINDTIKLNATVSPDNASYSLNWSSSNSNVVSVNSNGNITAHSLGSATIICTADSTSAKCEITVVSAPPVHEGNDDNISLSTTNKTISVGRSFTLVCYNCSNTSWSVNNSSIAEIQSSASTFAIINAISKGTTTVIAKNPSTGKTYRCNITVV